ncbi:tetratricopeptide repeat protein [Coraliomargarita sp. SDUM461004]|uniref:Tetratricopeptide repeat protein n=1 Tax=Thalassobacterium sedimentorum TaxID=3041258 RepID=A0ABU1AE63_9BACT|nr:tetratricopeptide repeat protein [Coraliomargarita sp. SDUM461004]MDQ8193055.1 tetratricopeptide repeat protein [Coraliomargarita sp. SDUM461004]
MNRQRTTRNPMPREKPILLGYVVQRKGIDGRMEISVRWGRLISTFLLLIVVGWFAIAGALYLHFKYNKEFDQVSYTKMLTLLPFGLEEHRIAMGNYHIEKGLAEIKTGNYRDALRLLRLGVARAPANLEGRRVLAEFYEIALKRHDIAADQLLQGLEQGGIDNIDYLKQTLRVLLRYQMDEAIQNLADKYLPDEPELTDINRTLAFGAANANYLRGNYDRADDYLISYNLLESLEGVLLSSQISWDRGNKVAAITKMEESIRRFPNSEPLLMQLSRYHRELGQIDEARRYAILRNVSDPLSAAPRLELLYIYNKSGDTEREQRETQRMLQQFRDDEAALQALANFAADTGNIDLARRTYEEALENEFGIDAFALLLIEAHLVQQDYEGALDFSEELLKERPDWLSKRWAIFNSLRAVASYGINRPDLGEIYLQDFIDEADNQPQTYLAVARRFTKINRHQQARKVMMVAYQKAPTNQKVLSELIRTELVLGNTENLNRLLSRLLQMRRPQMELLVEAYHKLGSDRFIFTPDRQSLLLQLSAILRENSQTLPELNG